MTALTITMAPDGTTAINSGNLIEIFVQFLLYSIVITSNYSSTVSSTTHATTDGETGSVSDCIKLATHATCIFFYNNVSK